jgi:hypothetical protein
VLLNAPVGGSEADPQAQAFSKADGKVFRPIILGVAQVQVVILTIVCTGEGFSWANFEFGGGEVEDDEDVESQRRAGEKPPSTCAAVQQDLTNWVDTLTPKGPVSKFFQRQITCVCLLCLLYLVRALMRKAQMLYYPDEPPPPDMAFPGWEGPGKSPNALFHASILLLR